MIPLTQQWAELVAPKQLFYFVSATAIVCLIIRSIWRVYFHPLSKFPGPKIAAASDVWYAYHSLSGRWPWAQQAALDKYGDIVRVAPNELVFVTPQALNDIYATHTKNIEHFPKTQINNHGNDEHGGIIWEWDPVRHRQVAKQLSPAFSGKALRAKEQTLHKYVDLFVDRMKLLGGEPEGVSLPTWVNRASVDISADMAYNREMNALQNMYNPPYLSLLYAFNQTMVIIQQSWRFPLLGPLKTLFLICTAMRPHAHIRKHSREQLERRIRRQGAVEHLDFIEQLIPEDCEPPKDRKEMRHLEQVAGQLLAAGYEPPSLWLYFTIYYLMITPEALRTVTEEIRGAFSSYDDIAPTPAAELPYLTACLKESLRMMPIIPTGMPVVSPGAIVDGTYIPKGTVCQSCPYALAHSSRYYYDARYYHPERWLPKDHALYDETFAGDDLQGFHPFSQGPRVCSGKEIAWWQSRLFIAKVLYTFNLEMVGGQDVDMERDVKGWGMFVKPEVQVRFVPAGEEEKA